MAAEKRVSRLLLEIKANLNDLKNLKTELKSVQDEAKKTNSSLGTAFTGFASAVASIKIKSLFDTAVKDANAYEQTLLGLNATAKLTGQNFEALKVSVTKLSDDGVLSIGQATTAMKTLLAQGIQADKAFSLLDAAKKVGAFNNIVGDTGQAVADFVKFLQTGSAELAENLDPAIIKVVKSLGGYEKVASDATAKQKLINAVIEKGGKLQGDYNTFLQSGGQAAVTFQKSQENLSRAIGEGLAPAYAKVQGVLASVLNSVAEFIRGLSGTSVVIGALTALFIAAVPAVIAFKTAIAGTSLAAGFAALLNPITLTIVAVAALGIAFAELQNRSKPENIVKAYRAASKEISELGAKAEALSKINKRTAEEERDLILVKEALRQKAKQLGVDYDKLAASGKSYLDIAKELVGLEKKSDKEKLYYKYTVAKAEKETIDKELVRRTTEGEPTTTERIFTGSIRRKGTKRLLRESGWKAEELAALEKSLKDLDDPVDSTTGKPIAPISTGTGKATPEYRFIQARDQLRELEKEYKAYIKKVDVEESKQLKKAPSSGMLAKYEVDQFNAGVNADANKKRKEAAERLRIDQENEVAKLRQVYAEYIEDKYQLEKEKIDEQTRQAIASVRERVNAGKLEEEKAQEDLAKIREKQHLKENRARIQSFTETAQAAREIGENLIKLINGRNIKGDTFRALTEGAESAGGVLAGAGKATGNKELEATGQAVTALGAIFAPFFGDSDAKAAEKAKREEEQFQQQIKLLQLQEEHQKALLEFQKSQALLPFKNLQRELRLVDIQSQRAELEAVRSGGSVNDVQTERLSKRSQLIKSTLAKESDSFQGGVFFNEAASSPEALSAALGDVDKYSGSLTLLTSVLNQVQAARGQNAEEMGSFFDERLGTVQGLPLPPQIKRAALDYIASIAMEGWNTVARRNGANMESDLGKDSVSDYGKGTFRVARGYEAQIGSFSNSLGTVNSLIGEFSSDAALIENLLSLFEQSQSTDLEIANNTKRTAANTEKLTLLDDRKQNYLDLGNRSIFSQGLSVDVDRIKLPTGAEPVVLGSLAPPPSVSSETVSELRKVVELINESNEYLALIAANTDNRASTDTSSFDNFLINKLAEIRSRRVA